jgi:hypothetical protein
MKYNSCFIFASVLLAILFAGNNLSAQDIHDGTRMGRPGNLTDQYNLGIKINDPVLPESLVCHGLKLDDIHQRAKQGIESVGWSQNQSSPYFVTVIITPKSSAAPTQAYTIEVEWGTDQSSLGGFPDGMGSDVTLSRTVVLSSANYTLVLAAVNDLSRLAAQKLQAKLFREFMRPSIFLNRNRRGL